MLRFPVRHFTLAPLLETLLPLLLVGRGGPLLHGQEPQDRLKWATLLQALSASLIANLSIARAEAAGIVQAYHQEHDKGTAQGHGVQGDGSSAAVMADAPLPPVLSPAVANILLLAARMLSQLPRDLWAPDIVPPALSDTLAAVAQDEVLCALLPALRPAALPALRVLRPDVQLLLDVAGDGEQALDAADMLIKQVPLLQGGAISPGTWLVQLSLALPALDLPTQGELLQVRSHAPGFILSRVI